MAKDQSSYPTQKKQRKLPWLAALEAQWEAQQLKGRRWLGRTRKKFRIRADPGINEKVRRLVHELGYRYILNDERLPGTPHLTFPSRRMVIFTVTRAPGLFRGGPPNPSSRSPEEREAWELIAVRDALEKRGWRCEIIAGSEVRQKRDFTRKIKNIFSDVKSRERQKPTS